MHINAPKEKVFKALSEAEGIAQWYTTVVRGEFEIDKVVPLNLSILRPLSLRLLAMSPIGLFISNVWPLNGKILDMS